MCIRDRYKICAVPANLYRVKADQLFTEILDRLEELGEQSPDLILERLASMSCKACLLYTSNLQKEDKYVALSPMMQHSVATK